MGFFKWFKKEIADILYGVTMEEQGVSKVISVELKDAKEYEKV